MRDIYLIDFENVASEGLSGITYLAPEDEVIIFYSNNSNRLSMKMHILIGKSVCKLDYFEASVGGEKCPGSSDLHLAGISDRNRGGGTELLYCIPGYGL